MTATYPLSFHRRIEQKWAERLKLVAARPAKAAGQVEGTLSPGTTPEPPQLSNPSELQPDDRPVARASSVM
jgi:hypothetical protein